MALIKSFVLILILLLAFIEPEVSLAQSGLDYPNIPQISDLGKVLARVILGLLGIAGGITIIYLVIAGIRYIVSGGDVKAIAEARAQITFALIGLFVILLAVTIITVVGNILGIEGLNVINIPGPGQQIVR